MLRVDASCAGIEQHVQHSRHSLACGASVETCVYHVRVTDSSAA
jgi:hypothetical protein